jgi:hypothetical protein
MVDIRGQRSVILKTLLTNRWYSPIIWKKIEGFIMTQQQMSKILDVPDRTLRDWKKSRQKLYHLLESLDYNEAKEKINAVDVNDVVLFEHRRYSQNLFWQTNEPSEQKVYAIISNYLSTMSENDIKTLCNQFGKTMVKSVLKDKYKKIYTKGYISTSGMDIPLVGTYNQNEIYRHLLGIINDC